MCRCLVGMLSFPLARTHRAHAETEINAKKIPTKFDWQRWEGLGSFNRPCCKQINRLIAGRFVDLRLEDRAVPLDPEVHHDPSEVSLRPHPVFFDPPRDLPEIVGVREICRIT